MEQVESPSTGVHILHGRNDTFNQPNESEHHQLQSTHFTTVVKSYIIRWNLNTSGRSTYTSRSHDERHQREEPPPNHDDLTNYKATTMSYIVRKESNRHQQEYTDSMAVTMRAINRTSPNASDKSTHTSRS